MQYQKPYVQDAYDYVDGLSPECQKCKNFGSHTCPAFREGVEDFGLSSLHVMAAAKAYHNGRFNDACAHI